jgi:hypothetical protein
MSKRTTTIHGAEKISGSTISDSIKYFDALPSGAFIRIKDAKIVMCVSSATLWRLIRAQKLKTHKHSPRTTSINVGELRDFLAKNLGE